MISRRSCLAAVAGVLAPACGRKNAPTAASKPKKHPSAGIPLPTKDPAAARTRPDQLAAFSSALGGNGVVLRHGAIIHQWGKPNAPLDVASASKPVLAHLVLLAVHSGRIPSLDDPVLRWLPALGTLNPSLNHKDAAITWRHLITQTSCYGVSETPGTAFDYCDFQMSLLWKLLFEKLYAVSPEDADTKVLRPLLFDRLDATDSPFIRIRNAPQPSGRLAISARDMARFGLLYLNGGSWNGQQLLPQSIVHAALNSPLPPSLPRSKGTDADMLPDIRSYGGGKNQEDHLGCYSFLWWLNRPDPSGKLLWPSLPPDAFAAIGNGGVRTMIAFPSLGVVASWNKSNLQHLPVSAGGREQMDAALTPLIAAIDP